MAQHRHQQRKAWITALLVLPCLWVMTACEGEIPNPTENNPTNNTNENPPLEPPANNTNPQDNGSSSNPSNPPSPNTPDAEQENQSGAQVYWLTAQDNEYGLTASSIDLGDGNLSDQEKLQKVLGRLLQGPANANVSSAIPDQTKLNTVSIKTDGVHVDISKEFTTGGGSQSMQGRLGQIIYTASSLNPKVGVWISIDGEPLEVLGGEGLLVSQPMTRAEFDKEFSL